MVLEMVARGDDLSTILNTIAHLVESASPGYRCHVSLLHDDGRLYTAAAPSLPAEWIAFIAGGVSVGPDQGSCGAAAWSGKPVLVADVTEATNWRPWVDEALANNLRACWAIPVTIDDSAVGIISVYHPHPRSPVPGEIDRLAGYAHLVAVALSLQDAEPPGRAEVSHPHITNLLNAEDVQARLDGALARLGQQPGRLVAVMDLEVRRRTELPSALGQSASNRLIQDAVAALEHVVRRGDTIARVGVDRFLVIAEGVEAETEVVDLAHRLVEVFAEPFSLDGNAVVMAAVCGVAVASTGDEDVEALLNEAAMAAGVARESGRGTVTLFDESLARRATERLTVELGLARALRHGEFVLHFQPTYSLPDESIIGFEALIRWQDPERGLRPPADFMAVAEESGIVVPMTRWVLDAACAQAAKWREDEPDRPLWVAVNLSAAQLEDARIIDDVRAVLEAHQIPPAMLHLEVTETAVMADAAASVEILRGLKSLGVGLAIDDFGTGYSSLAYLRRLPVDALKIDREFVKGLATSPEDAAIVEAVLTLAATLGLEVIAEGVETAAQLRALQQVGCPQAQGFYWAKPCSADEAIRLPSQVASGSTGRLPTRSTATPTTITQVSDVLSVLNHELRAPLSVISLLSDPLANDDADAEQKRQRSQAIQRQVQVIATLLDSVTTARLVEEGTVHIEPRQVDLGEVVAAIVSDYAPLLTTAIPRVVTEPAVQVSADPARVQQLVVNLLSNADKYSPAAGRIDVLVSSIGNEAVVSVRDQGPGVAPDRVGTIFRKFGRADRTVGGLGLGLFIARGIAMAHGGDLRYRRVTGGGSEFTFVLPLTGSGRPAEERLPV